MNNLFNTFRNFSPTALGAAGGLGKLFPRRAKKSNGQACLWVRHDGVALVHLELLPGAPALLKQCAFLTRPERGPIQSAVIRKWVQSLGMETLPYISLLEMGQYTLFPVEEPQVPRAERAAAIKWRVKDRLDFPVTEAVVDVFDMPGGPSGRSSGKVYVVAARESEVRECAQHFLGAKLNLVAIDILELALANLTNLLEENQEGICLLRLGKEGGIVQVTRQDALYLSRTIDVGTRTLVNSVNPNADSNALAASQVMDTIALEVQRTLDYYESYFSATPVARLYVAPMAPHFPHFEEALAEKMGVMVGRLPVQRLFAGAEEQEPELLARCLPAMGAALRPLNGEGGA